MDAARHVAAADRGGGWPGAGRSERDAPGAADFDDTVHQRVRLGILAVLSEARRADFGFLRDALELTDGNSARHVQVLEAAGLVRVKKGFEGKRPRTWVEATRAGRAALAAETKALRELIERIDGRGR